MVWCILNGVVREVISNKSSEQKLNDTRGHLMYIGMYYIYIYIFFFSVEAAVQRPWVGSSKSWEACETVA